MSLQLHRPDGQGGLEPRTGTEKDWRRQLRSPRWGTSLRGERLPEHKNTEMEPTSRARSVLFWLALAVATFVLLVAGYASGFWNTEPARRPPLQSCASSESGRHLVQMHVANATRVPACATLIEARSAVAVPPHAGAEYPRTHAGPVMLRIRVVNAHEPARAEAASRARNGPAPILSAP